MTEAEKAAREAIGEMFCGWSVRVESNGVSRSTEECVAIILRHMQPVIDAARAEGASSEEARCVRRGHVTAADWKKMQDEARAEGRRERDEDCHGHLAVALRKAHQQKCVEPGCSESAPPYCVRHRGDWNSPAEAALERVRELVLQYKAIELSLQPWQIEQAIHG